MPGPITVTATQGGSTANGMALRVVVLTGAATLQNGATGFSSANSKHDCTITTTVTGSQVYCAVTSGSAVAVTAEPGTTTLFDNIVDSTNGECYATGRTTTATGTPGGTIVGASAPITGGGCAALEVLPAGTMQEDPSAPAVAWDAAATTVTTASFTPPAGTLLVAMVAADGGGSTETMTVSGGGLIWTEAIAANASSDDYAGVWTAQLPPPDGFDPVVTVTQGGSVANGMLLRVKVLTGTAATQNGATASLSVTNATAAQTSITTTVTGSQVYGALVRGSGSFTAATGTTLSDNFTDSTNGEQYGTCRTTSATGTPGAVTVGASAPSTSSGHGVALVEILPAGTITEDASGPAVATTTGAGPLSSPAFTPPYGALLVAMVSSDGGAGVTTFAVSGAGLMWTPRIEANTSGNDYAGVWTAQVPPAPSAGAGAAPGRTWQRRFHHRQLLPPPLPGAVTQVATAAVTGAGAVTSVVTEAVPAALAGAGTATAVVTEAVTASLAAAGTVTAAATVIAGAALTGAGSVSDVATQIVTAALTGAGSLTANATTTGPATAAIAGAGAVTALATQAVTASPAAAGTVTAAAAQRVTATAAGAAAVIDVVTQAVTASVAGAGSVTANSSVLASGTTATLAGAGAITAKAVQIVTAAPAGTATLAALATQRAAATLTGAGALTAAGTAAAAVQNAVSHPVVTGQAAGNRAAGAVHGNAVSERTAVNPAVSGQQAGNAVTATATSSPAVSGG